MKQQFLKLWKQYKAEKRAQCRVIGHDPKECPHAKKYDFLDFIQWLENGGFKEDNV